MSLLKVKGTFVYSGLHSGRGPIVGLGYARKRRLLKLPRSTPGSISCSDSGSALVKLSSHLFYSATLKDLKEVLFIYLHSGLDTQILPNIILARLGLKQQIFDFLGKKRKKPNVGSYFGFFAEKTQAFVRYPVSCQNLYLWLGMLSTRWILWYFCHSLELKHIFRICFVNNKNEGWAMG